MNEKSAIEDASVIRRYLLGQLNEEQQAEIEARLFADDTYFGQVELEEDTLIDAYLNSELSNEEVRQFESHFLTTPGRRHALDFSTTIRKSCLEQYQPSSGWNTLWSPILPSFSGRLWSAAPIMIIAIICLGGTGYLATHIHHNAQREIASRDKRIDELKRLLKQSQDDAGRPPTALKDDVSRNSAVWPLTASHVVRRSPEFVINTLDHKRIVLSEHRGKVVALLFVLTGCPHCQECAGILSRLQGDYGHQGFRALAAAIDEAANVPLFIQQVRPTFPVGFADRFSVAQYLQSSQGGRMMMPQLVLLDRSGMIREQHRGDDPYFEQAVREKNLRASIERLLDERR